MPAACILVCRSAQLVALATMAGIASMQMRWADFSPVWISLSLAGPVGSLALLASLNTWGSLVFESVIKCPSSSVLNLALSCAYQPCTYSMMAAAC